MNKPTSTVTGLTQLGARAYDPALGKFLSVDPVLDLNDPQQNNGYSYSHNNPVTKSDPSGLIPWAPGFDPKSTAQYQFLKKWGTAAAAEEYTYGSSANPYKANGPTSSGKGGTGKPGSGGTGSKLLPSPRALPSPVPQPPVSRVPWQTESYSYHYKNWLGVGLEKYSTKEIAKIFKEHPGEIFLFTIEGCSSFCFR